MALQARKGSRKVQKVQNAIFAENNVRGFLWPRTFNVFPKDIKYNIQKQFVEESSSDENAS